MKENFISNFADFAIPELKPKYQVQRFDNKKGDRFYYFVNDEGQIVPAIGVTTFLGKVMPESKFLTDWKLKFGKDWEIVLNLTAEYGTHLHIGVGYIMLNRTMPDDKFIEEGRSIIKALKKYDKSIPLNMIEKNLIEELPYKEANPLVKKIQEQIKQQTDANISEQSKECEQG